MSYKKQMEIIIEKLKEQDMFFHDPMKNAWVQFQRDDHWEIYPVNSDSYMNRIYSFYYDQFKDAISISDLKWVVSVLEAYAKYECEELEIHLRTAEKDGKYYYDLSNENFEVAMISKNGLEIVNSTEVLFKRFDSQTAQAYPEDGGRSGDLINYLNIDKKHSLLFYVYLVSCYIPDIQHPILILQGESGSGKSTISSIIKELVDPCEFTVTSLPEKEEDLFLIAAQNWVTVFDNVTKITSKQSDNLCKLATGIASIRRRLYTDNEVSVIKVLGCIVLNSIQNVAEKEDLINRSLLFRISKSSSKNYKPQNELLEEFEKDKPKILNRIFRIIIKSIRILPTVEFSNNFRMAEFAKVGYAIAEAMGGPGTGEEFLKQYRENIEIQESEVICENTLLTSLIIIMKNRESWYGTSTELFNEVNRIARLYNLNLHSETMPNCSSSLTKRLNALVNFLLRNGIKYTHEGHTHYGSKISLKKI